jgi:hypothetical protein
MNTFPLACPADSVLLDEAIARFKTPGIRDLDHSAPYIHNSKFDTLDNAVGFYLGSSSSARAGTLRNGANALKGITLLPADISPHVAFLKSLNEDYQQGRSTEAGATSRCTIHRQRNGGPSTPRAGAFSSSQRLPALLSEDKRGRDEFGIHGGDALRLFLDLFRQVVLDPHLLDRFQLRLDPIDVLVHVFGHILQHVPRGEVGHLRTMHHAIA